MLDFQPMDLEARSTRDDLEALIAVKDQVDTLYTRDLPPERADLPKADLLDLGRAWQLRLEVPGVDQADLELALLGDELIVGGRRPALEEDLLPVFTERPSGPFQRAFRLPGPVEAEAVTAHLRGGVLVVQLPKRA